MGLQQLLIHIKEEAKYKHTVLYGYRTLDHYRYG